jgi:hypothetical protein
MGNWSGHGNPLYFLVAFLIKTPIPSIIFFVVSLTMTIRRRLTTAEKIVISAIALFFITSSLSRLQLGLRYILPLYPLVFIISSRCIEIKNRLLKTAGILLCFWYITASLFIWPDYLSYFNSLIGGADNGYKYLRDSNIDWGQDLPALADYINNNNINSIVFEYFGQDDPKSYGIKYRRFNKNEYKVPQNQVYAISSHCLEHAEWATAYTPTTKAGYSIFIYDFRKNS